MCSTTAISDERYPPGLVAYLIGLNGNVSPATMSANIKAMGLTGVISGIRMYTRRPRARRLTPGYSFGNRQRPCAQRPVKIFAGLHGGIQLGNLACRNE